MSEEKWELVACAMCGSLVHEKVDEDGTPTYRPLVEKGAPYSPMIYPTEKFYHPVFSGKTQDNRKVTIYKHRDKEDEFHISLDDGDLQALSPDSEIFTRYELDTQQFIIQVNSPEWSGTAIGDRWDLLTVEAR